MKRILGIAAGMVALSGAWAQAAVESYEYQIRIPQTSSSCQQEAEKLGARFEAATGIKPTASQCLDVVKFKAGLLEYTLYSLSVSYAAPAAADLYTANYGLSEEYSRPSDSEGVFMTYEGCLAKLDSARQTFEAETGLQITAATCLPGKYNFKPNYVLRLDGFGKPLKKLRLVELKFLGHDTGSADEQVDELIRSLGGTAAARVESKRLVYAPDTFAVKHDLLGRQASKEECLREVTLAQSLYAKLESQRALVFCLPTYGLNYSLEAVREGAFFLSGDFGSGHGRFYSFDECMNTLSRIDFRGSSYVGGLCHASDYADGQYELEQYSRL